MSATRGTQATQSLTVTVPCAIGMLAGAAPDRRELTLPDSGVVLSTEGSVVWIDGLTVQSHLREKFLADVRAGEVPSLLPGFTPLNRPIAVRAVSAEATMATGSLLSALDIASPIARLFAKSTTMLCSSCGERMGLFHSPTQLAQTIISECDGQGIELFVTSTEGSLSSWAEKLGFDITSHGARVDSLIASSAHESRIASSIRSAWKLPELVVRAVSPAATFTYSPGGVCRTCGYLHATVTEDAILRYLSKREYDSDEHRGVEANGITLQTFVTTPLANLAKSFDVAADRITAAIDSGLGSLTLGNDLTKLDSEASIRASVAAALLNEGEQVVILDAPLDSLSSMAQSELLRTLRASRKNRTVVIVNGDDSPNDNFPSLESSAGDSTELLLELPETKISIRRGTRLTIETSRESGFPSLLGALSEQIDTLLLSTEHRLTSIYVPLITNHSLKRVTVSEELKIFDRLCILFASSESAKMAGLNAAAFRIGRAIKSEYVCGSCRGLALTMTRVRSCTRPIPSLCPTCSGARFRRPVRDVTFKGTRLHELLNRPLSEVEPTLRALPKTGRLSALLKDLGLGHLPLGLPVALLSPTEFRLLTIARALSAATPEKPVFLLLEHPFAGLSEDETAKLANILNLQDSRSVGWIAQTNIPVQKIT